MAPGAAVVLPLLVLEHPDLLVTSLLQDGRRDLGAVEQGRTHLRAAVAATHQEDLRQGDLVAGPLRQPLHVDGLALGDPVLLAAAPDDRVHGDVASFGWSNTRT